MKNTQNNNKMQSTPLNEKREESGWKVDKTKENVYCYFEIDVKEHIERAEKRLKAELENPSLDCWTPNEIIDKIWKEEFGEFK